MKQNVLKINMSKSNVSFSQIIFALHCMIFPYLYQSKSAPLEIVFNQGTDVEHMKCQKLHHDHKAIYCGWIVIFGGIYKGSILSRG